MKRWFCLALAATLAACNQRSAEPAARINGSLDVALVGDLLFVTSTDGSELRALDLARSPRTFVRAPNPLEPLAIPVVERPQMLARDIRYADEPSAEDGTPGRPAQETSGPYLYALGAGGGAISVVNGNRTGATSLTEVTRIQPFGAVTAMAAIGPGHGRPSRLYVAVTRAQGTDIVEYRLPDPESAAGTAPPAPSPVLFIPGEWVNTMVVMPVGRNVPEQLAIATRRSLGQGGQTFLFDPEARSARPLLFPGPLRLLATHGESTLRGHPAGRFLYGALDEDACGGGEQCKGVIAVEVATGRVAVFNPQAPNPTPMPVLSTGAGLPMGISLVSDASLNLPGTGIIEAAILGVLTTSTGQIYFIDAAGLRHFDLNPEQPVVTGAIYRAPPTAENPDGPSRPYEPGGPLVGDKVAELDRIRLGDGAARTESIQIVSRGVVPGLAGLPTEPGDGVRFPVPAGLETRARVGDRLLVVGGDPQRTCEVGVAAIEPAALIAEQPLPAACADRRVFSVRADAAPAYVVSGSASGYLGRASPNAPFVSERSTYFNLPESAPRDKDLPPVIAFRMGPEAPTEVGARYVLDVESSFSPFGVIAAPELGGGVHLAGRPVYDRAPHGQRPERVFIAFPSADAIVGLNPLTAQRGDRDQKAEFYR